MDYLSGLLRMETKRNMANIGRKTETSGQNLHHFISNSPWSGPELIHAVQDEIKDHSDFENAILDVTEAFIGPNIALFSSNYIVKPPGEGKAVQWHQDGSFWPLEPMEVVSLWLAIDDATPENGCMRILPRLHKRDPFVHFKRRDWQICDHDIDELQDRHCLTVPLKPGGCLFFSSLLPHGTPANTSAARRRALQFHYRPLSAISIGEDERMAVFGGEGKDVEC